MIDRVYSAPEFVRNELSKDQYSNVVTVAQDDLILIDFAPVLDRHMYILSHIGMGENPDDKHDSDDCTWQYPYMTELISMLKYCYHI